MRRYRGLMGETASNGMSKISVRYISRVYQGDCPMTEKGKGRSLVIDSEHSVTFETGLSNFLTTARDGWQQQGFPQVASCFCHRLTSPNATSSFSWKGSDQSGHILTGGKWFTCLEIFTHGTSAVQLPCKFRPVPLQKSKCVTFRLLALLVMQYIYVAFFFTNFWGASFRH